MPGTLVRKGLARFALVRRFLDPIRPTGTDVIEFWSYMCSRNRVRVVHKSDSEAMRLVGQVLDSIGVMDKRTFLDRFTTIIPIVPFRGIYTPFEVGTPYPGYDLWTQIRTCVHEINHLKRADAMAHAKFAWDYLVSPADRAHEEMHSLRAEMELEWWAQGKILTPYHLAIRLGMYGCGLIDCEVTEKELIGSVPAIRANIHIEPATAEAIPWLQEKYGT